MFWKKTKITLNNDPLNCGNTIINTLTKYMDREDSIAFVMRAHKEKQSTMVLPTKTAKQIIENFKEIGPTRDLKNCKPVNITMRKLLF